MNAFSIFGDIRLSVVIRNYLPMQKWLIQIAEGEFPTLLLINMFLLLIDLCVSILILVMMCERGTEGENRFGPDPLSDGREVLMEPEPGK